MNFISSKYFKNCISSIKKNLLFLTDIEGNSIMPSIKKALEQTKKQKAVYI